MLEKFSVWSQWRELEEAEDGLSEMPSCSSSPWIRAGMWKPGNPPEANPMPEMEDW